MLNIGTKVRCVKQFSDCNGVYDGEVGTLTDILDAGSQKYIVYFPETEHGGYYRQCHSVEVP